MVNICLLYVCYICLLTVAFLLGGGYVWWVTLGQKCVKFIPVVSIFKVVKGSPGDQ